MSWIKMSDVGETGHPMKGVEYLLNVNDDTLACTFYWSGFEFYSMLLVGVIWAPESIDAILPIPEFRSFDA